MIFYNRRKPNGATGFRGGEAATATAMLLEVHQRISTEIDGVTYMCLCVRERITARITDRQGGKTHAVAWLVLVGVACLGGLPCLAGLLPLCAARDTSYGLDGDASPTFASSWGQLAAIHPGGREVGDGSLQEDQSSNRKTFLHLL